MYVTQPAETALLPASPSASLPSPCGERRCPSSAPIQIRPLSTLREHTQGRDLGLARAVSGDLSGAETNAVSCPGTAWHKRILFFGVHSAANYLMTWHLHIAQFTGFCPLGEKTSASVLAGDSQHISCWSSMRLASKCLMKLSTQRSKPLCAE